MTYVLILLGFIMLPGHPNEKPFLSSDVYASAESCQSALIIAMDHAKVLISKGIDPVAVCVPIQSATNI